MIPEKPKDRWINAKDFSWLFEYDPSVSVPEEEWYSRFHMTMGILMQNLADEAEHNGIEIVRCKDCIHCRKGHNLGNEPYYYCDDWEAGTEEDSFCSDGVKRNE